MAVLEKSDALRESGGSQVAAYIDCDANAGGYTVRTYSACCPPLLCTQDLFEGSVG